MSEEKENQTVEEFRIASIIEQLKRYQNQSKPKNVLHLYAAINLLKIVLKDKAWP